MVIQTSKVQCVYTSICGYESTAVLNSLDLHSILTVL